MTPKTYLACSSDLSLFGMLTLKYFIMPSKSCASNSFLTIMRRARDTFDKDHDRSDGYPRNCYLKYCFNSLQHENIQNSEHQEKWELSREECEEPLAGIHVGLQPHVLEVLPQVRQALLYQPVKLIKPQL